MPRVHGDPLLVERFATECALVLELCCAVMSLSDVVDQASLSLTNKPTPWLLTLTLIDAGWIPSSLLFFSSSFLFFSEASSQSFSILVNIFTAPLQAALSCHLPPVSQQVTPLQITHHQVIPSSLLTTH